ncbi:RidA family protein [Nocardioides alcanivorans]|uniref:RidA family protein n=1 Tax=Nocardioides alcanivorans TaxID=2897352 RepID=UPI001F2034D7|nr:RidA family protein [Nocardioides alcanivorans]
MKTPVRPPTMKYPVPLSPGVMANGFLFVSGFGPQDPTTGGVPDGIEEQTRATLANLTLVLAEAGLDLSDVVKVTVHLRNLEGDFVAYNDAYSAVMPAPYPSRITVGSDLIMGILVEMDAIAVLRT